MTLNLIKLSVGIDSVEALAHWQAQRLRQMKAMGERRPRLFHRTGQKPKRDAELLNGGSIYWVIKGLIQARQKLLGFDEGTRPNGRPCCLILLDRMLVPVQPSPRRAFQGWRYLEAAAAPADLAGRRIDELAGMPPQMRKDLAELGLL